MEQETTGSPAPAPGEMHTGEVRTDPHLVHRLLAAQFPHWAHLPVTPVASAGTDNAIYRLGEDLAVRLPRIHWASGQAEKEARWLPRLAPLLPVEVPTPLALGEPAGGYPWRWSVVPWLPGAPATLAQLADPVEAARDMADFLLALQQIDPAGGPAAAEHNVRGLPLAARDRDTRRAIAELDGMYDPAKLTAAWEAALSAPDWDRAPVWIHGDVLPGNLLFHEGRLTGVIDFGGLAVGDPACDLMIAWGLFSGESRAAFREALEVDAATWRRGRGHALSQAAIFIPYYLNTNPVGVGYARRAIEEILAEVEKTE